MSDGGNESGPRGGGALTWMLRRVCEAKGKLQQLRSSICSATAAMAQDCAVENCSEAIQPPPNITRLADDDGALVVPLDGANKRTRLPLASLQMTLQAHA